MTQQQLAERFQVDKSSVYLYERGDRSPPTSHLMVLAELGADVNFIVTGRSAESLMEDEWLSKTMGVVRELHESGVWAKLDWDERQSIAARILKIE